jgi:ankyrin repeat protein
MSSDKERFFPQLPPQWAPWLKAFELLAKHGASVHEINRGKTLSMLNINDPSGDGQAVDYFRILLSEGYIYWETADKAAWSAVFTAIRTRTFSLQALKLLVKNGVNISRIFDDGRSPLHLAAELAEDVEVLEYLCTQGCLDDLDRQDEWGWTPLHFAIIAAHLRRGPDVFGKARFLLSKGADFKIKGRVRRIFYPGKMPSEEFTPVEMCRALDVSLYKKFVSEAETVGVRLEGACEGKYNLS